MFVMIYGVIKVNIRVTKPATKVCVCELLTNKSQVERAIIHSWLSF